MAAMGKGEDRRATRSSKIVAVHSAVYLMLLLAACLPAAVESSRQLSSEKSLVKKHPALQKIVSFSFLPSFAWINYRGQSSGRSNSYSTPAPPSRPKAVMHLGQPLRIPLPILVPSDIAPAGPPLEIPVPTFTTDSPAPAAVPTSGSGSPISSSRHLGENILPNLLPSGNAPAGSPLDIPLPSFGSSPPSPPPAPSSGSTSHVSFLRRLARDMLQIPLPFLIPSDLAPAGPPLVIPLPIPTITENEFSPSQAPSSTIEIPLPIPIITENEISPSQGPSSGIEISPFVAPLSSIIPPAGPPLEIPIPTFSTSSPTPSPPPTSGMEPAGPPLEISMPTFSTSSPTPSPAPTSGMEPTGPPPEIPIPTFHTSSPSPSPTPTTGKVSGGFSARHLLDFDLPNLPGSDSSPSSDTPTPTPTPGS